MLHPQLFPGPLTPLARHPQPSHRPPTTTTIFAQVSGAKFYYLRNEAALLELALINWTMQKVGERGLGRASTRRRSASHRAAGGPAEQAWMAGLQPPTAGAPPLLHAAGGGSRVHAHDHPRPGAGVGV